MKKDSLKSVIVIAVICLVIAALMAAINGVTAPMIAEANAKAEKEALFLVIDGAEDFERVETDEELPESVVAVYSEVSGKGYAVMLNAKGYDSSNPMVIAVGIDNDGNITKCHVVSCNGETSGIGTKVSGEDFLSRFAGADEELDGVDTISGATISSSAFIDAVGDAFGAYEVAKEAAE
ncbi:MAG: FMN-binding protein [Clostridia bacterium]|nr:FMN-binding protein [Clostridia bacterium]